MTSLFRGNPFEYHKFKYLLHRVKKYEAAWFCSVGKDDEEEPVQFWNILKEFDYEGLGKKKCVTICRKLLFGKYHSYLSSEITSENNNNKSELKDVSNKKSEKNIQKRKKSPNEIEESKMMIKLNDFKDNYKVTSENYKKDSLESFKENNKTFYSYLLNECKKNPTTIKSNKIKNILITTYGLSDKDYLDLLKKIENEYLNFKQNKNNNSIPNNNNNIKNSVNNHMSNNILNNDTKIIINNHNKNENSNDINFYDFFKENNKIFYDYLFNECKKNPTTIKSNKIKNILITKYKVSDENYTILLRGIENDYLKYKRNYNNNNINNNLFENEESEMYFKGKHILSYNYNQLIHLNYSNETKIKIKDIVTLMNNLINELINDLKKDEEIKYSLKIKISKEISENVLNSLKRISLEKLYNYYEEKNIYKLPIYENTLNRYKKYH